MKKIILLALIVLFAAPFALADISITTNQQIYNLGDKILASASVMQEKSFEGIFRLGIACGDYSLKYFLTPVSLEANFRTAINVPEVAATSYMLGNCTATGSLLTNDNLILEEKESNAFLVTSHMFVLPVKTKISALPGDSIEVTGVLNEAFGNNVMKASLKIRLDNNSYELGSDNGRFNLTISLPKTIKSGAHLIEINSFDAKGNSGSSSILLDITAIPTYIKMDLKGENFAPGSRIYLTPYLYDQANELVNDSLELQLDSPKASKLFRKIVQSNAEMDYEFSQYSEPGRYVLSAAYKNLLNQAAINITSVREVKIEYKNETVIVENVGNIPFLDEITFILESGLKKYPITKKISVEPGKLVSLDLSQEVPSGIYDVAVGIKDSITSIKDGINKGDKILAAGAAIHDNRPIYKKIESGLFSISGSLVGSDGLLSKNPVIAPMILAAILLFIAVRYGRKPIMKLIKRKKDKENNKEL